MVSCCKSVAIKYYFNNLIVNPSLAAARKADFAKMASGTACGPYSLFGVDCLYMNLFKSCPADRWSKSEKFNYWEFYFIHQLSNSFSCQLRSIEELRREVLIGVRSQQVADKGLVQIIVLPMKEEDLIKSCNNQNSTFNIYLKFFFLQSHSSLTVRF